MTFLATVDDSFQIQGRGCVIVPDHPGHSLEARLKARDRIQLRNPNGRVLDTYIVSIELLCGPKVKDRKAFLLPDNISKSDTPKGTEIWLANSN